MDEEARPQGVGEWREALAGSESRKRTTKPSRKTTARACEGACNGAHKHELVQHYIGYGDSRIAGGERLAGVAVISGDAGGQHR